LNINTLTIPYHPKCPNTGLILCKILVFNEEKLQNRLRAVPSLSLGTVWRLCRAKSKAPALPGAKQSTLHNEISNFARLEPNVIKLRLKASKAIA
jgi:hypothetical protein